MLRIYLNATPVLLFFLGSFAAWNLYPLVAISPVEEMRRTSLGITLVCAGLGGVASLSQTWEWYVWVLLGVMWFFALFFVPLGRALSRHLFAHKRWWGYPVVILGAGRAGRTLLRILRREPGLGLKAVVALDDDPNKHGVLEGVPVVGGLELAPLLARGLSISYALVAMPNVPHKKLLQLVEHYGSAFSHLLIVPDLFGLSSLRVPAKDLGGVVGLEVRQQLLLPGPQLAKRILDVILTIMGGILILPFLVLIAIWIKLDSPGPAFYVQQRLGREGRVLQAVKFRTMYGDGETRLKSLLDGNPALRAEYEVYHKLRNDPRVTRAGRVLR